jgi:hypothetical protein
MTESPVWALTIETAKIRRPKRLMVGTKRLRTHLALVGLIDDSLSGFMTISSLELHILAVSAVAFFPQAERSGALLQFHGETDEMYRHQRARLIKTRHLLRNRMMTPLLGQKYRKALVEMVAMLRPVF